MADGVPTPAKRVSIVVPVKDDARLSRCLDALAGQDADPDRYEVLVVDNGSRPRIASPPQGGPWRLLVQPRGGSYAARNFGADAASGDVLAFVDADCIPPVHWVGRILETFEHGGCDAATGPSYALNADPVSRLVQRLEERRWAMLAAERVVVYSDTRNLAVRRDLFRRVPFDHELGSAGDIEWALRITRAGGRVCFLPELAVGHEHVTTLAEVRSRGIRRGRGMAAVYGRHGRGTRVSGARPLAVLGLDLKALLLRASSRPLLRKLARPVVAASARGLSGLLNRLLRITPHGPWDRIFELLDRASLFEGHLSP